MHSEKKFFICNSFVILLYISIDTALGKPICVDNTFKDNPKPAQPLRRPIESCVTKVPAETTTHVKCETPRQHGFKFSETYIRKNGNIRAEKKRAGEGGE